MLEVGASFHSCTKICIPAYGETEAQGAKGLGLCPMRTVCLLDADGQWPSPHSSNCHSSRDKGKHNTASWPPEPQSGAVPKVPGCLGNSTALNSAPVCGADRQAVLGELRRLPGARSRPRPPRARLCSPRLWERTAREAPHPGSSPPRPVLPMLSVALSKIQ